MLARRGSTSRDSRPCFRALLAQTALPSAVLRPLPRLAIAAVCLILLWGTHSPFIVIFMILNCVCAQERILRNEANSSYRPIPARRLFLFAPDTVGI